MQIGMIGLGRMGANMVRRLMKSGHQCVVFDNNPANGQALAKEGATPAASLQELVNKLSEPKTIWLMVPAGEPTENTVVALAALLPKGSALIDGGNSFYQDDVRRSEMLKGKGVNYMDVGTSGVSGSEVPEIRRYNLNLPDIAEVWRRGSVIGSWLLDLTAMALAENPTLDEFSGFVDDSGEGRWTINAAIEEAVPANVLSAALYARFRSRRDHSFGEKVRS